MDRDTKAALRQRLRQARDALGAHDRKGLGRSIGRNLLTLPWLQPTAVADSAATAPARCVALYAAFESEPVLDDVFVTLQARGLRCCFPAVQPGKALHFVEVSDLAQLRVATYGIREPQGAPMALEDIDLVVLPGLGFDRHGGRLGYGAGYYDRALAHYNGICVGLAYARQLQERLPAEPHDRSMDAVVTEQEIIAVSSRTRAALGPVSRGSPS